MAFRRAILHACKALLDGRMGDASIYSPEAATQVMRDAFVTGDGERGSSQMTV